MAGDSLNLSRILLATQNAGKVAEIRRLAADITWISLADFLHMPVAPEDGATFAENARAKALYYFRATGLPALADDSGLEVDALGGQPGVHSVYFAGPQRDDAANNAKLVAALRGLPPQRRTARFRCAMAFAADGRVRFESAGVIESVIIDAPRGSNGFGYDPYFFLPERGVTLAELSPDQKNAISHRGQALRAMIAQLERRR